MTLRLRPAPSPSLVGLALLLVLQLGGCAALSALDVVTREPPRLFSLRPATDFDNTLPEVDGTLAVEVPTATAGLNRARIALRPTPTRLDYYGGVQWVDVVPVMVQNLLIESFDAADSIDVLGRSAVGLRANYALLTDLRDFQAEYPNGPDGPPVVHVRIQARLVRLPRRVPVAATSVESAVRPRGSSAEAIVLAFDEAFGEAVQELVEWTVRQIASQEAS